MTIERRIEKMLQKSERILNAGKKTNFDRITESPEALAEFITKLANACAREFACENCPMGDYCADDNDHGSALEWLKQESTE